MRDARRNATVTASTELTALVLTARDLRQIAEEMAADAAGRHLSASKLKALADFL
jgi:CRP-like cAMP-binding protein